MMEHKDPGSALGFTHLVQIGAVVRDAQETMERLSEVFGFGPWIVHEWPKDRDRMKGYYRGQQGNFRFLMAFTQLGSVELELVQPLEGDNVYSDFLRDKGEGLHHIHFDLGEVDAALDTLSERGVDVIQSGTGLRPGAIWAYLSTGEVPGFGGITIEVATKVYDGDQPPPRE